MKSVGIVRKVDELGRIVLPVELRRTLEIAEHDPMEIYVDGSSVILRKLSAACIFCSSASEVTEFRGKWVCRRCRSELKK